MLGVTAELDGSVNGLEQGLLVDTSNDEVAFVDGLGSLSRGTDADGGEGMADAGEERGFLGKGAAIADDGKSVHLETVVVVEAERLMLNDTGVELEARGDKAIAGTGVATVEDGHVILLRHLVDSSEEGEEVLLRVDNLLTVSGQENVLAFLQTEALVDVAGLDISEVVVEDFRHGGPCDIGAFLRQAAIGEVSSCVLRIGHVHVGDDIDDTAVGLLWQTLVLAAVAGLHVENGDMESLGSDDAEAAVGVAKDQYAVRLGLGKELVGAVDDVAASSAKVVTDSIHIDLGFGELQILEEYAVEIVVVVLACMGENHVEVLAALVDDGGETDDLGARADNDNDF